MVEEYYSDGVTRITDPFYTCICPEGHKVWEVMYTNTCSVCGRKLVLCMPADQYAARQKRRRQYQAEK